MMPVRHGLVGAAPKADSLRDPALLLLRERRSSPHRCPREPPDATRGKAAMNWPQAQVGAITIDVLDRPAVLARIAAALDGSAAPAVLVSVNLDHVHHFAATAQALPCGTADGWQWYTLLDGQPVVRAARRRLPAAGAQALPGSELLEPTLELAARSGARLGLVGGSTATREYWQHELPARYPGLRVA